MLKNNEEVQFMTYEEYFEYLEFTEEMFDIVEEYYEPGNGGIVLAQVEERAIEAGVQLFDKDSVIAGLEEYFSSIYKDYVG